ncbi:MerR family transcriptional regulator [Varunaivibrio sulfuroxidans]|uniref:MerR-like DNA binding protein n=1 Tax=Varunaivibrio sulfuroxidans TaxID=1773489 RepID=A0A4R3J8J0_9PROT|nr:MerR family transcriptional regulator [Varunaivibrio sulfuroxidans]TCS61236.1 MerR-like DNA binding protein [Varunaivibrio sulfuroxidans]WES31143.1 MerR family transcriptional regulator [Varunaivibrio sulfuroxidans]
MSTHPSTHYAAAKKRRNGKSENAFRTISEVADELSLASHVLRFWETKFAQIQPMKRGGGRRYYRPEDVALLRQIRTLLYDKGYTIKGVQKLMREGDIPLSDEERLAPSSVSPDGGSKHDGDAPDPSPRRASHRDDLRAVLGELEALRDLL